MILGCGYVGSRLARSLVADGQHVVACTHNRAQLEAAEALGAEAHSFEATRSQAFRHALGYHRRATVVYALPLIPGSPPGDTINRAIAASLRMGAERFVYLSSTAIYGEGRDGQVVDEGSPLDNDDPEARVHIGAEGPLADARANGLDTIILRLSSIYGPGRGVRERLRDGSYKLLDDGQHVYSRVHVDDVVGIIRAAVDRAPTNATYCVADDRPCPQGEYAGWLAERMELKAPPSVPALAPGQPRHRIRNRAVSNAKLKRELDYTFRYPSYVEGEQAIERDQGLEVRPAPPPPLVIHRRGASPDQLVEQSQLRRLALSYRELAPGVHPLAALDTAGDGSRDRANAGPSEALLMALSGGLTVHRDDDRQALEPGDVLEIPAHAASAHIRLEVSGAGPATLAVIRAR
ncbi:MAG: hypothetical protein Tsb0020_52220 [Haliangiales bacterium]